jgi:PAS domain S-box-containing protein
VDSTFEEVAISSAFNATVAPYLLLDSNQRIRAANRAYLDATHRELEDLLGKHIFEAFPDNPHDPHADGVRNLAASLEHVLAHRQRHSMWIQRYDIPRAGGGFIKKVWSPVNSPIEGEHGQLTGILHHVEDITDLEELVVPQLDTPEIMEAFHAAQPARTMRAIALAAKRYVDASLGLAAENQELRRTLSSRSTIEQAKGIVMSEMRVDPDAAFDLLVRLSQAWDVTPQDVAAAFVYDVAYSPDRAR